MSRAPRSFACWSATSTDGDRSADASLESRVRVALVARDALLVTRTGLTCDRRCRGHADSSGYHCARQHDPQRTLPASHVALHFALPPLQAQVGVCPPRSGAIKERRAFRSADGAANGAQPEAPQDGGRGDSEACAVIDVSQRASSPTPREPLSRSALIGVSSRPPSRPRSCRRRDRRATAPTRSGCRRDRRSTSFESHSSRRAIPAAPHRCRAPRAR